MSSGLQASLQEFSFQQRKARAAESALAQFAAIVDQEASHAEADEIEALYASETPTEIAAYLEGSSFWEDQERKLINTYFARPDARRLTLRAIPGTSMLNAVIGAQIDVAGDLLYRHLGFGAAHSSIRLLGSAAAVGNYSRESMFDVLGNVSNSLGAGARGSRFKARGYVHSAGSQSDSCHFDVTGDVGHLLKGAKHATAQIRGDARYAALTQANTCSANVFGRALSSVLNSSMSCQIHVAGEVSGKVFVQSAVSEVPIDLPLHEA